MIHEHDYGKQLALKGISWLSVPPGYAPQ